MTTKALSTAGAVALRSHNPPGHPPAAPAVATLFEYTVSARGIDGDIRVAIQRTHAETTTHVVDCINPHSIIVAKSDDAFRTALLSADLLLPDGTGIVLAARMLGLPIRQRVTGTDFFLGLSQQANRSGGLRYFFLGSTPEVLEKIDQRLKIDFPNIVNCGSLSPPFKATFSSEENREMVQTINAARPDVLWVGMTAPKQEKWIEENRDALNVPLACAIGAVFDFYSGTKKRAPQWLCNLGLEWLPRLLREPKRLWRRNFVSTPQFLARVAVTRLRIPRHPATQSTKMRPPNP